MTCRHPGAWNAILQHHVVVNPDSLPGLIDLMSEDTVLCEMSKMDRHGKLAGVVEDIEALQDVLLTVASRGYNQVFRELDVRGFHPEEDDFKEELLEEAATSGSVPMVRLLLDKGCGDLCGVLASAASCGHESIMRLLLERGADISDPDVSLQVLQRAAGWPGTGEERIVRLLLEEGAQISNLDVSNKCLLAAASAGHEQIVRLFLQWGADITGERTQERALYEAAQYCCAPLVWRLLCNHSERKFRNYDLSKLVSSAVEGGNEEIVQLIVNHVQGDAAVKALIVAARCGNYSISKLLLDSWPEIAEESQLKRPFLKAAARGHLREIELLISRGVNPTGATAVTALSYAAAGGHEKTVEFFLEKSVDLRDNFSVFHGAVQGGNTRIVARLLDHGAEVNARSSVGRSLFVAISSEHKEMAHQLLDAGMTVDDNDGDAHKPAVQEAMSERASKYIN